VWAREAYRSHSGSPRSSTPGTYRTRRSPPTIPAHTRETRTRTLPPSHSTGRGAPGAGACPRLQQTRPAHPISAPRQGNKLAPMVDSAGNALKGLQRGSGSGRGDTSPTGKHDSFEKRTGGLSQEGIRRLMPGRRGHGFRTHTTRQLRHESCLRLTHHYMRMLATCPARAASGQAGTGGLRQALHSSQ
jgi:hypothetical protein